MSLVPGIERGEPPAIAVPTGGEAGTGHHPVRILVVDDNPDSTALLVAVLEAPLYLVEPAPPVQAAPSSVAADPRALMLLDVMLPDLDGHEVARRVKYDANLPFIPVILVTAKSELRDKIYGLEQGADDFLSKPVNNAELIARVRALLRLKEAQDRLRSQNEELRRLHRDLR